MNSTPQQAAAPAPDSPAKLAGHKYRAAVAGSLRAMLARRGMTQADLAERLGVSAQWVGRRYSGAHPLSVDEVAEIAFVLGIETTDLVGVLA